MKLLRNLSLLVFLTLLSACDLTVDAGDDSKERGSSADSVAVGFQAYVNRATKAGQTGDLTTDVLKTAGFGVLGYSSNGIPFNERSKPDFMYNQPVTCLAGAWTYEPVKYWPNEENDRVSFFAYAPFVEVTPSTGLVAAEPESGILGLSHYLAEGDPQVWYRTTLTPGRDVDLCWGIPFLNQAKQKSNERLQFDFHHALSQLNVQIDADIDGASQATTRIYVRSVTFTGFMTQGSLNLNSTGEPIWNDISGTERPRRDPVTFNDGRIDGEEGRQGAIDVNEKWAKLNPLIIQTKPYDASEIDGVKETPANLFDDANATVPVLVVPLAGTPMSVTIVYDVETVDNDLGLMSDGVTHGLSMENRISRQVLLDNGNPLSLEAGKKYIVKLHLGLASVKFDANVATWDDSSFANIDLQIPIPVEGISIDQPVSTTLMAETSQTLPLTVSFVPAYASNKNVIWTSSDPSVATIDENGVVAPVGEGVATITATSEDNPACYDTIDITVVPYPHATSVSVSPVGVSILKGQKKTLTATVYPEEALNKSVIWTSSNLGVATVNENGVVTAVADGNATITVTTVDGNHTATCEVLVYSERIMVLSKNCKPDEANVTVYFDRTLKTIPNATYSETPWSSSDPNVATIDASTGKVTPVSSGTTIITVTATDGRTNSLTLRVIIPVVSLVVRDIGMTVGDEPRQLQTTIKSDDADIKSISWLSSDSNVATVDSDGIVTAVAAGEATITATIDQSALLNYPGEPCHDFSFYFDPVVTATCKVTVKEEPTLTDLAKLSKDALDGALTGEQASQYIGKYVMADGSFGNFDDVSAAKTGGAVGMVAYISTISDDPATTDVDEGAVDPAIPGSRVLVLRMTEIYKTNSKWGSNAAIITDKEGYALSAEYGSDSNFVVLNQVWTLGFALNDETGAKGHWFLPSKSQMEKMGATQGTRKGVWALLATKTTGYITSTAFSTSNMTQYYNDISSTPEYRSVANSQVVAALPVFAY